MMTMKLKAIMITFIGVLLVVLAFIMFSGGTDVTTINANKLESDANGQLVYVQGALKPRQPLADTLFGVSEPEAVGLRRMVEVYQLEALGSDELLPVWSDELISLDDVETPNNISNPSEKIIPSNMQQAESFSLGVYNLNKQLEQKIAINNWQNFPFTPEQYNALPASGKRAFKLFDGTLYYGVNPEVPRIGDMRITFQRAMVDVSVVAQLAGGQLIADSETGGKINVLRMGRIDKDTLVDGLDLPGGLLRTIALTIGGLMALAGAGLIFMFRHESLKTDDDFAAEEMREDDLVNEEFDMDAHNEAPVENSHDILEDFDDLTSDVSGAAVASSSEMVTEHDDNGESFVAPMDTPGMEEDELSDETASDMQAMDDDAISGDDWDSDFAAEPATEQATISQAEMPASSSDADDPFSEAQETDIGGELSSEDSPLGDDDSLDFDSAFEGETQDAASTHLENGIADETDDDAFNMGDLPETADADGDNDDMFLLDDEQEDTGGEAFNMASDDVSEPQQSPDLGEAEKPAAEDEPFNVLSNEAWNENSTASESDELDDLDEMFLLDDEQEDSGGDGIDAVSDASAAQVEASESTDTQHPTDDAAFEEDNASDIELLSTDDGVNDESGRDEGFGEAPLHGENSLTEQVEDSFGEADELNNDINLPLESEESPETDLAVNDAPIPAEEEAINTTNNDSEGDAEDDFLFAEDDDEDDFLFLDDDDDDIFNLDALDEKTDSSIQPSTEPMASEGQGDASFDSMPTETPPIEAVENDITGSDMPYTDDAGDAAAEGGASPINSEETEASDDWDFDDIQPLDESDAEKPENK